jgi:hypothetical protein
LSDPSASIDPLASRSGFVLSSWQISDKRGRGGFNIMRKAVPQGYEGKFAGFIRACDKAKAGKRRAHGLGLVSAVVPDGQNAGLYSCGFVSIRGSTELFLLNRAGWRRLNLQRCGAGFPLTFIHR